MAASALAILAIAAGVLGIRDCTEGVDIHKEVYRGRGVGLSGGMVYRSVEVSPTSGFAPGISCQLRIPALRIMFLAFNVGFNASLTFLNTTEMPDPSYSGYLLPPLLYSSSNIITLELITILSISPPSFSTFINAYRQWSLIAINCTECATAIDSALPTVIKDPNCNSTGEAFWQSGIIFQGSYRSKFPLVCEFSINATGIRFIKFELSSMISSISLRNGRNISSAVKFDNVYRKEDNSKLPGPFYGPDGITVLWRKGSTTPSLSSGWTFVIDDSVNKTLQPQGPFENCSGIVSRETYGRNITYSYLGSVFEDFELDCRFIVNASEINVTVRTGAESWVLYVYKGNNFEFDSSSTDVIRLTGFLDPVFLTSATGFSIRWLRISGTLATPKEGFTLSHVNADATPFPTQTPLTISPHTEAPVTPSPSNRTSSPTKNTLADTNDGKEEPDNQNVIIITSILVPLGAVGIFLVVLIRQGYCRDCKGKKQDDRHDETVYQQEENGIIDRSPRNHSQPHISPRNSQGNINATTHNSHSPLVSSKPKTSNIKCGPFKVLRDVKIGQLLSKGPSANLFEGKIRRRIANKKVSRKVMIKVHLQPDTLLKCLTNTLKYSGSFNIFKFYGVIGADEIKTNRAMSYVIQHYSRGPLNKLHKRIPMNESDYFGAIAHDICNGIAFLHSSGMVHRGICCANLLMGEDYRVVIGDLFTLTHNSKNPVKKLVGEWPWLAPETLRDRIYSEKTDIWSIGCTIYEILSQGEEPYGYSKIPERKVSAVQASIMEGKRVLVPPMLSCEEGRRMLEQCLQWDPERRPTALLLRPEKEFARHQVQYEEKHSEWEEDSDWDIYDPAATTEANTGNSGQTGRLRPNRNTSSGGNSTIGSSGSAGRHFSSGGGDSGDHSGEGLIGSKNRSARSKKV
ncbi:hypothetical protein AAMO2058_000745800 [Amorphochlora amoebiformis]